MRLSAIFPYGLVTLPTVGMMVWAWRRLTLLIDELHNLIGFEGMHLVIESRETQGTERAKCPIPG
jgi:hypothetical protein